MLWMMSFLDDGTMHIFEAEKLDHDQQVPVRLSFLLSYVWDNLSKNAKFHNVIIFTDK